MKFAVIATIAALAIAQDAAESKSVSLAAGSGANAKATSSANVNVALIAGVSGTVAISQSVDYPAPSSNNIVQSWICIEGASDNGGNVYAIANGTYINTASAASIATFKTCGAAPESMSPLGANTVRSTLSTTGCSLAVQQTYVQVDKTFTHAATVAMLPAAASGSLVLGASLSVNNGWNVYINPAGSSATVDSFSGSSSSFTLDGALALTLSGAAAAVAAVAF
jgi:hypothetical protein